MARVLPEPRVWFNPDLKSTNFMVPGVVGLVLMIITMTLTSLGIVKEKEIGTMEQLLVTPIKPYQLILGKLIPFTIIGFADVLIVLALAHYWFSVPMLGSLPLLFGLSGLFILTTLGLGLFISTIATDAAAGDADRTVLLLHAVHVPLGVHVSDRQHAAEHPAVHVYHPAAVLPRDRPGDLPEGDGHGVNSGLRRRRCSGWVS